jgi:hypothetical protein
MRCENAGSDYDENNIQWTCKADVPDYFKLGATDVICEGYSSSEDPYILTGSCGVEYRLLLTEKGEAKYGKSRSPTQENESDGPSWMPIIFWFLFAAVVVWMIYSAFTSMNEGRPNPPPRRPRHNGGGGRRPGNDDDDDDDAPPPYTPYTDEKPWEEAPTTASSSQQSSSRQQNRASSSRGGSSRWPGFGSGLAAGAAAGATGGYLYGQRQRTQLDADLQDRQQQRLLREERARRANEALRRDSDSSSGGSNFHSTTGFGESRRR